MPATSAKKLNVFVPITKVDAVKGIVYGVLAAEEKDRSGEIFDYKGSKPHFQKWSQDISKATDGKSVGNLRAMHGAVAAGKFTDLHFNDDDQRIEVTAKVVDKNELEKVLEGVYSGFSIGGSYEKRWKDGDVMRYIANPVEGSLVDLPCIASATFEIVKADGATELRKFNVPAEVEEPIVEPTNDEVAEEAKKLAKAAGDETKWLDQVEPARAALKAVKKKKKPFGKDGADEATDEDGETETDAEKAAKAAAAGSDADLGAAQVWTHPDLPGKTFAKKADLRTALVENKAAAEATHAAAGVTAALSGMAKSLSARETTVAGLVEAHYQKLEAAIYKAAGIEPADAKIADDFIQAHGDHATVTALAKCEIVLSKESGELIEIADATKAAIAALVKAAKEPPKEPVVELSAEEKAALAKSGAALADGSFAIEKREDVGSALVLYEDAANKAVAKRHITRRARALKAVDLLPEDWGVELVEVVDLKKIAAPTLKKAASLYGVGSLIQLLAQVDSCEESLESPAYGYGTMVPKALCDRFGAVLVEMGDIVAEVLDVVLAEIRAEEASEAGGMVTRAQVVGDLLKCVLFEPLVKAGARHSRSDMTKLNSAHDLIVELGAVCDEGDDAAKGTTVDDLRKVIVAKDRAFEKTMTGLMDLVKDIGERVKSIESTPLPEGTTSVDPRFRTIEKGFGPNGGDYAAPIDNPNRHAFAEMIAEVGRYAIDGATRHPINAVPGVDRRGF